MNSPREPAITAEQFAMLSQQASALSAAVHALLATVAVPATAALMADVLRKHEADANASAMPESAYSLLLDLLRSLSAAADRGSRQSTCPR